MRHVSGKCAYGGHARQVRTICKTRRCRATGAVWAREGGCSVSEPLQADESHDCFWMTVELARRSGDASRSSKTQQADGCVSQACHCMRTIASAHLGAVLVVSHVTHVVKSVLDVPMLAVELQQVLRTCLHSTETGQSETQLACALSTAHHIAFKIRCDAFDAEYLTDMREVDVAVELGTGANVSGLDSAMALIDSRVLRGGNPPGGGLGCPRAASVGCL